MKTLTIIGFSLLFFACNALAIVGIVFVKELGAMGIIGCLVFSFMSKGCFDMITEIIKEDF